MMRSIDKFLNGITMYRLMLYYLLALWGLAFVFSMFGLLPFSAPMMAVSLGVLFAAGWAANTLFARVFGVPANVESIYITVLILALIITPVQFGYGSGMMFLFWAAVLAMASKYILAIWKKHIFNPAAASVALTALFLGQSASWWIGGNAPLFIFVLAGGMLVVRKILRADLVLSFLVGALISISAATISRGGNVYHTLSQSVLHSTLLFFAFVMITEPLTTPPTRRRRMAYGFLVGILFGPSVHYGPLYSTPELALLAGNIFSYLISPKKKLVLKLKERVNVAEDVYDFVFIPDKRMRFRPGQYLEWTLGHKRPDARGNRRYFTIASSPTERELVMGVKFYPEASSYKKRMLNMHPGDTIVASQLAGDFTLPRNKKEKLLLIAGGIGVTPFRSMLKYLLDRQERRDIVIIYSNRTVEDIAYKDLFEEARTKLGIPTIYTLTDSASIPSGWTGERGYITREMLSRHIPDLKERKIYISGPHSMVTSTQEVLSATSVPAARIKTDFFPGFA